MDRPPGYYYWEQLIEHIVSPTKIFDGKMTYPRQIEIHLPGDGQRPCNFHCFYCAGKKFIKDLGQFEEDGLKLIRELDGRIPYHIHGGSYTEPIMNPYLMRYLEVAKETDCHFGIHTNGSLLKKLEKDKGWLTRLSEIAEDKTDYLSVSLDAGRAKSHCRTKGLKINWFDPILEGIELATHARDEAGGKPAVRLCYLMNQYNSSQKEIDTIVKFAKRVKTDSLRFSIPFASYAQSFDIVRKYKHTVEIPREKSYYKRIRKHLSCNTGEEQPFIFWFSPKLQDIDLFNFKQCAYGYYQICLAADGYVYRCTTISTPTFKRLRFGKTPDNLKDFKKMLLANQDPDFRCDECFDGGARCNRMGIEINSAWRDMKN